MITEVLFRPRLFTEPHRLRGALWWDFDDLFHPLKSRGDQFELGQLHTRQKPTKKGSLSTWSTFLANLLR